VLLFDNKALVTVIRGKIKKGKPGFVEEMTELGPPSSMPEKQYQSGYEQAAYEMITAVKSGDALNFAHSLKNFIKMCDMEEEDVELHLEK